MKNHKLKHSDFENAKAAPSTELTRPSKTKGRKLTDKQDVKKYKSKKKTKKVPFYLQETEQSKLADTMLDTTLAERVASFCQSAGVKKPTHLPKGCIGIVFDTTNDRWFHIKQGILDSVGSGGSWPLVSQEVLEREMERVCRDTVMQLHMRLLELSKQNVS